MSEVLDLVQSRKWMVTINNPLEHGFDHEKIKEIMAQVKGNSFYWCMCDEEGDECETVHTHIFIYRSSPFTARQIDNLFPNMHRDKAFGSTQENRAYVLKDGEKFHKESNGHYNYVDAKGKVHIGINFSDTFYESGECPQEHQGVNKATEIIVEMIKNGSDDRTIVNAVPAAFKDLDKIARTRSMFRDSAFANTWRDLEVSYIFGPSGVGKTRSVMDSYGYDMVYRVTDYKHPFDTYDGQDVIVFEEFRGGLKHGDMLNYLDGYPILLPCRYFNRQACYTKVFVISNLPPDEQYTNVDKESRLAFFRRFTYFYEYHKDGSKSCWPTYQDYVNRSSWADGDPDEQLYL